MTEELDWNECVCGCGVDAYEFNEWVRGQRDAWIVVFEPRSEGDKKPWRVECPLKMPKMYYYEQGWNCYCRQRFRTKTAGESWISRKIFKEEVNGE